MVRGCRHAGRSAPLVVIVTATAMLALAGCAAAPGASGADTEPPYRWKAVGTSEAGCTLYTKVPKVENVLVDTAVYTRIPDGRYVLDLDGCLHSSD